MGYSADTSPLIGQFAGPTRRLEPLGAQRQEKGGPNHLTREGLHATTPLITDKLRSYSTACRAVMPSVLYCTDPYANNRAEVSHQPTRPREHQMRRFKSAAQLQRFASVHGIVQNLFRVGRHLLRSAHDRLLRTRAFVEWDAVTCAC